MHHAFITATLCVLLAPTAWAQIYKCTDASGKTVFSQTTCAAGAGGTQKQLSATAPKAPLPPSDGETEGSNASTYWANQNAAANARAAQSGGAQSYQPMPLPYGMRKTNPAAASDKQIAAECEANRGTQCNSASEIAQRRMEKRELTAEERRQQQGAIAARRERELEESFNRSNRR